MWPERLITPILSTAICGVPGVRPCEPLPASIPAGARSSAWQASKSSGSKLGALASKRWGRSYRAIGTDATVVRLADSSSTFTFSVKSPVRGIFAGTYLGYLEMYQATPQNHRVLDARMPMASAGTGFTGYQAWIPVVDNPLLPQVKFTPNQAWDALIYIDETTPVTPCCDVRPAIDADCRGPVRDAESSRWSSRPGWRRPAHPKR